MKPIHFFWLLLAASTLHAQTAVNSAPVAPTAGTIVGYTTISRTDPFPNQAGELFETNFDGPMQFQSTKPIQVAQFGHGNFFDYTVAQEGDPCELLLPPVGRYLTSYVIYSLPNNNVTGDFGENFLNLIVPQSATNSTQLDGSPVASTNFTAIGSSGYYGAQIPVVPGPHTISSSQPVEVHLYGWGTEDAYSYFGGLVK